MKMKILLITFGLIAASLDLLSATTERIEIFHSKPLRDHYARMVVSDGKITVNVFRARIGPEGDKKLFELRPEFYGETFVFSRADDIYVVIVDLGYLHENRGGELLLYKNGELIRHVSSGNVEEKEIEWFYLVYPFQKAVGFILFSELHDEQGKVFFVVRSNRGSNIFYDIDTGELRYILGGLK